MAFTVSKLAINIIRTVQLVLALLLIGLMSYVTWHFNAMTTRYWAPGAISFLLFTAIFSTFSLIFLVHLPVINQVNIPVVALALEAVNAIFFLAGFIAVSVFISHLAFCSGRQCAATRAATAFAAMQFLSWAFTTSIAAREFFQPKSRTQHANYTNVEVGGRMDLRGRWKSEGK